MLAGWCGGGNRQWSTRTPCNCNYETKAAGSGQRMEERGRETRDPETRERPETRDQRPEQRDQSRETQAAETGGRQAAATSGDRGKGWRVADATGRGDGGSEAGVLLKRQTGLRLEWAPIPECGGRVRDTKTTAGALGRSLYRTGLACLEVWYLLYLPYLAAASTVSACLIVSFTANAPLQ